MRIRTDGDRAHRVEMIEMAADLWDCNKTDAVLRSCEYAVRMDRRLRAALEHPDMTPELAEVLSTPDVPLRYEIETGVESDQLNGSAATSNRVRPSMSSKSSSKEYRYSISSRSMYAAMVVSTNESAGYWRKRACAALKSAMAA